jgi:DNA repair exonuclease SbcCD ATPase subunit
MRHENKTVELDEGKNLIFGKNTSGKSSIAKAIAYGLTGKLPFQCDDPRKSTKKYTKIDLTVEVEDDKSYLVRRSIPKGKKVKESIFIYDAEESSKVLYTDEKAEDFLKQLLGLSSDVFERIIYMKEEDVYDFLANPENGVITEIDRLIGLEKAPEIIRSIEELDDILNTLGREFYKSRHDIEKGIDVSFNVDKKAGTKKQITKKIEGIKRQLSDLKEIRRALEEKDKLADRLSQISDILDVKEPMKFESAVIEQKASTEKEKKNIEKKISDIKTEIKKIDEEIQKKNAKFEQKETIIRILKQQKETDDEKSICPTCAREMDPKLTREVISKLEKEMSILKQNTKKILVKFKEKDTEKKAFEKKDLELEAQIKRLEALKREIEEHLQIIQQADSMLSQFKDKDYPETIKGVNEAITQLENKKEELAQEKGKIEGAEKVTKERVKELEQKENDIKHQQRICDLIIDAISESTKKLRADFSADVRLKAEEIWNQYKAETWKIDWDENLVPIAKPIGGERELSAYKLSGSERFLILLAIRLAFLEQIEQFKLLIIDEPCQQLDDDNGQTFRDILTTMDKKAIAQSIVFTYNPTFLDGEWNKTIKL